MALSWIDFINGETLANIRSKLNSFNTSVEAQVNINTGDIVTNRTDLDSTMTALTDINNGEFPMASIPLDDLTGNEPIYKAGQLYYANEVFNLQAAHADVTLQIGREQHMEVINNSGATIVNGSACRHNGVIGGLVQVELALSNTFNTARVLGVATHNIPNGEKGILTTFGFVGDVDTLFEPDGTTPLPTGSPLYLSDVVPGRFTSVPPDIITQVGGSLIQDALGTIFVSIDNSVSLPTTISTLRGQTTPDYTVDTIPTMVTSYITNFDIISTSVILDGTILLSNTGWYDWNFTYSGTVTDEEVDVTFELYDITHDSVLWAHKQTSGRGANPSLIPMADSITLPIEILSANTNVGVRVSCSTVEDFSFDNISFSMKSIHLR